IDLLCIYMRIDPAHFHKRYIVAQIQMCRTYNIMIRHNPNHRPCPFFVATIQKMIDFFLVQTEHTLKKQEICNEPTTYKKIVVSFLGKKRHTMPDIEVEQQETEESNALSRRLQVHRKLSRAFKLPHDMDTLPVWINLLK